MRRPGHDSRGHLLTPKKGPGGPHTAAASQSAAAAWQTQTKKGPFSPGLPQGELHDPANLRDWAEAVTVSVTGFESMVCDLHLFAAFVRTFCSLLDLFAQTEHDGAQPWASCDTFFCVQYADEKVLTNGYELYFSRHMMSEFCKLHAELSALDEEVKALPFAPRSLGGDEHSEEEVKGRQEELDKWLRSVVWAVAAAHAHHPSSPHATKLRDPKLAGVLQGFLCGAGSGETPMDDCLRRGTSFAIPCGGLRPRGGAAAAQTAFAQREPEPEPEPEPLASAVSRHVSDDEDEIVCRICRMEGEDDWPLFFPCKCSGSIKWVHQDCLQTWMQHSGITSCELCKHAFDFTPICDSTSNPTVACDVWLHVDMLLAMTDSPDAPKELPAHELLRGLFT